MSIIQEALKKVQVHGGKGKDTPLKLVTSPKKKNAAKRTDSDTAGLVIVSIVVIMLFTAGVYFIRSSRMKAPKTKPAAAVMPAQEATYREVANITPKVAESVITKEAQPGLTLNGIMYLEKAPQAIINNSIVCEDDTVQGAKVTKINEKNVVLQYGNTEITLYLK